MILGYALRRGSFAGRALVWAAAGGLLVGACGGRARIDATRVPDGVDAGAGASGSSGGPGGSAGSSAVGAGGGPSSGGALGTAGSVGSAGAGAVDAGPDAPPEFEPGTVVGSRMIGASGNAVPRAIATDGTNVILAVELWGDIDFGGKGDTIDHGNLSLVSYDANGNYLWHRVFDAQRIGDVDLEVDANRNLYLAGIVTRVTFGSEQYYFGSDDVRFLAKLSPTGEPIWSKGYPARYPHAGSELLKLGVDAAGRVFLAGALGANGVDFGPRGQLGPGDPLNNSYLVRFDGLGNALGIERFTGLNLPALGVDADGSSVVATWEAGPLELGGPVPACNGEVPCLTAARFDASGNRSWLKQWPSSESGETSYIATGVVVRGGATLITGYGISDFGSGLANSPSSFNLLLDGAGAYVRAYHSDTEQEWAALSPSGTVYVTGYFNRGTTVGGKFFPRSSGNNQFYAAAYDAAGAQRFARVIGSCGCSANITGIVATASGPVIAGGFTGTLDLDRTLQTTRPTTYATFVVRIAP